MGMLDLLQVPTGRRETQRVSSALSSETGVALVAALIATLVLAVLGISLLFTTLGDDRLSQNYAAEVDALFAANSGLQVGIRHAMIDAEWDAAGQWGNHILAVGSRQPGSNASSATGDGCSSPLPCLDAAGTLTGRRDTWVFDLRWFQGSRCAGPRCTDTEWAALADEPYGLPYNDLAWTNPAPGQFLPNGGSYRLLYQSVPRATSDPPSGFVPGQLRIVSIGLSGTPIVGVARYDTGAGTMTGSVERRAVRSVSGSYRVKDVGIWSNAFFVGGTSTVPIQGGAIIRGSLHLLNQGNAATVLRFTGGGGIRNNYSTVDEPYIRRRIPPPLGDPHGLGAELRVRGGNVHIQAASSTIGLDPADARNSAIAAPPTLTVGKGPLDGIYMGTDAFPSAFTGRTANHYEDVLALPRGYDVEGWSLPYPDYDADYTDTCNPANVWMTSGGLPGYQRYLKGEAGTTRGVHALDLSPLGADLVFDRTRALSYAVAARSAAIVAANDDEFAGTPRLPPGGSDGNVDIYADTALGIVGVFKHLPGMMPENVASCLYGDGGGGHGFLYIPPATAVADPVKARRITEFIERNLARYEPTLAGSPNADVNAFLGRAPNAAAAAPIAAGALVDGAVDTRLARLLVHGVIYVEDHDIGLGGACPQGSCAKAGIVYMGRGTFAAGDTGATKSRDVGIFADDKLISLRTYPCIDALGVMAPDSVRFSGPGNPDMHVMGAFYGRNDVRLDQNVEITGSTVSWTVCSGCSTGNRTELTQVPDLAHCLPPKMIGDWSFYVAKLVGWSEH